jgi:tRNA(fMet)-specific endonuclease VapC
MAVSGKYLLDTNIVIALFAGELSVLEHLKDATEVYIPSGVIGELYYGAHKSSHVSKNLIRIEEISARFFTPAFYTPSSQRYRPQA